MYTQADGSDETLQAVLMAVNIPNDEYRQESWARNGSGAAQGNNCHMETAVYSPTEQESKVIGVVLKALDDLKSDMRTIMKIQHISDGTMDADAVNPRHKSKWCTNERREKTKSNFTGAMVKGTKIPNRP
jgi:hypothetical protein